MRIFSFIHYFYYLSVNWNLRIAWHILRNEIRGEKKYGIQSTGVDELKSLEKKDVDISHATIYMPAGYDLLEEIFSFLQPKALNHMLDIGCGKGRALCVAAHYGFTELTGLDFSRELCQLATRNLQHTQQIIKDFRFSVINNEAFYFDIPPTVECIFLFNPFDEFIMNAVVNNIEKSYRQSPRPLYVVYLNPLQKSLFLQKGYEEIFHTRKLKYLEGSVLKHK